MRRQVIAVVVTAVVLSACVGDRPIGSQPPAPTTGAPSIDLADARPGSRATLLATVVPQWEPGPDGQPMVDEFGENPYPLEAGAELVVLEQRRVGRVPWLRAYVLPDWSYAASDFFTWLPATDAYGNAFVAMHDVEACPDAAGVAEIAALSYLARARCFAEAELTLEGVSWFGGASDYFAVEPPWLGADYEQPTAVALHAARNERGSGLGLLPQVTVHVPPDVALPPYDHLLRVHGTFNHPAASGCTRRVNREIFGAVPPDTGLTDGSPEESEQWCRGQFVAAGWELLAGPEGRPVQAGDVQLHRTQNVGLCAGVGMPPMVFRVDPTATDPIWLETQPGAEFGPPSDHRIMAMFGAGFRVRADPQLVVLAPAPDETVVVRDGQPLDPDAPLFGYPVCPMGEIVAIMER